MISKSLQASLAEALRAARENRHEYLCVEHLLYALCHDEYGREIIMNCGGDPDELRKDLDQFFLDHMALVPEAVQHVPQQTLAFERLLQRAIAHVHHAGKREVDAGDILAALFEEEDSHAAYYLAKQDITRLDVLDYISHGIGKLDSGAGDGDEDEESLPGDATGDEPAEDPNRRRSRDPLQAFCVNLTQRAAQGRIDPLIGRNRELTRTVKVLCRRQKNNPVFVGDPGVGKTAMAEGLALRIYEGNGRRSCFRRDPRPGPGRGCWRAQVPRRLRAAAQGGDRRTGNPGTAWFCSSTRSTQWWARDRRPTAPWTRPTF